MGNELPAEVDVLDQEGSEVEEPEVDFDPCIDNQNHKDPNALDLIGKRVRVPVSYYGPLHKRLREAAGVTHEVETIVCFIPKEALQKPEVYAFVRRAYEGRRARIAIQDYWFATETVDGDEQWYPFTRKKLTNWGNTGRNKTDGGKVIKKRDFLNRAAELDERRREPNLGPNLVEVVETDEEWTEMPPQSEMSTQITNKEMESLIKCIKEATVNRPDWDSFRTKSAEDMIVDREAQEFVLKYCLSRRNVVFQKKINIIESGGEPAGGEASGSPQASGSQASGSKRKRTGVNTPAKRGQPSATGLAGTETLPKQKPFGYCTRVLGKNTNTRAANAAARTKRFCLDCDMYLCGPCSKKCQEHAQARRSHKKISTQSAKKKERGHASNAKQSRSRTKRSLIKKDPSLFQTV
jgi:hypothetical protein